MYSKTVFLKVTTGCMECIDFSLSVVNIPCLEIVVLQRYQPGCFYAMSWYLTDLAIPPGVSRK